MSTNNQNGRISKVFKALLVLLLLFPIMGMGSHTSIVHAQNALNTRDTSWTVGGNILSNGQFVYGPNVGNFNFKDYIENNVPYLSKYTDDLYGRAKYFSINPKVYLTLLEIHSQVISKPDATKLENPFDLNKGGFISQIDYISNIMVDAYYRHIYTYSFIPVSQRKLAPLRARSGDSINVLSDTNAGTYAIISAIANTENEQDISAILDSNQSSGFYQTYQILFPDDNPTSTQNHIYIPGELDADAAPPNFLQLPYLRGKSWRFNGVHNFAAGSFGSPFTDASSIDISPGWPSWNTDTSDMWVVAAASGTPTKISNCYFEINHADGWETDYYHLENIQNFSGWINQNDKIGVIANTLAEATCNGGSSTGPHVHFSLKRNGAFVAINGSSLSGWDVHSGRWNYDSDSNYMWLERSGIKKFSGDLLLSEGASEGSLYSTISGSTIVAGATLSYIDGIAKTTSSQADGSFSFPVTNNWSGSVTPTHPCYTFNPNSRTYTNVTTNQTGQNYTPSANASIVCVSRESINFGNQLYYTKSDAKTTTLTNNQSTDVHLGSFQRSSGQFILSSNTCAGATLTPSQSCTFDMQFKPTAYGALSGTLTINSDAVNDPVVISLDGVGLPGTQLVTKGGSFEQDNDNNDIPDFWDASGLTSLDGISNQYAKHGTYSAKLVGQSAKTKTLKQPIVKNGSAGDDFLYVLWSRAQNVPGGIKYRTQVSFYNGNTLVERRIKDYTSGTHDWEYRWLPITVSGDYTRIEVEIIYSLASGTVWFDSDSLKWAP
jgi:LasA protease